MSRTSSDEQFQFLLSCIRYSNNGKVDFAEVAKECNIVSKGAAAKRYERMMKAHGINPNGGPCTPVASASPDSKSKETPESGKAIKRKTTSGSPLSKKAKIKKAAIENAEKLVAPMKGGSNSKHVDAAENNPYFSQEVMVDGNDDDKLFEQFCNTGDDFQIDMKEEDELFE